MTTPSILETALALHTALTRATAAEVDEASRIDDELQQLPAGGYPLARSMLTGRAADVQVRLVTARRAIVAEYAALLCLRTDDDGGCDIDLPAKRPAGRPKKTEAAALAAARAALATNPPADPSASAATAETPATPGADAFFAVVANSRTPEQARVVLRERSWAERDMDLLTATALIEVARRNLRPEQVEINEDGGAGVAGGEVIP